jgi:rhodanese-related sulfurtransferase
VLDVRGVSEFESGHIQGAKNVPLTELTGRLKELEKQKPHPIVVVCASGTRSSAAVATLTKSGFMGAVSLDGGISAWQSQGLPVVK